LQRAALMALAHSLTSHCHSWYSSSTFVGPMSHCSTEPPRYSTFQPAFGFSAVTVHISIHTAPTTPARQLSRYGITRRSFVYLDRHTIKRRALRPRAGTPRNTGFAETLTSHNPVLSAFRVLCRKKTAETPVFLLFLLYNRVLVSYDRVDRKGAETFLCRFV
jgi:hypothetical protein